MPIRVTVAFVVAALSLSPPVAVAQRPVEIAFADPQPHFVAAWAPTKAREAERSAVLARRLSLELADVSLDTALKALTNRAGLRITYSQAILPKGKRVTIKAGDIAVVTALTEMLFRSGLDVVVDQDGAMALVRCKHAAPRAEVQDSGTVVGTVTDKATGAPIAGATVIVEGTKWSATTDNEGRYRISGLEPGTYPVRARYIGYAVLTTSVTADAGKEATADFALLKSVQKLDELVTVTPGGMQTEVKALPTPVSVIDASDIARQQSETVQELLRQAVPTAVGWRVPANPQFTLLSVRGASSFTTGSPQMKVFVDGVEVANHVFAAVDPSSIERVEVIRGPQGATIYGADAIGGVIQISTKRGDPSASGPHVNAEAGVGVVQTPYTGFNGVVRQNYRGSIHGGAPDLTYTVGAGYSHTSDWIPNGELSSESNPSVYGAMRFARGPMTVDLFGRFNNYVVANVQNPELARTGFAYWSQPFYSPLHTENQSAGVRLSLASTSWLRNIVTVGIDRYTAEFSQQRARLTYPGDTLLSTFDQSEGKKSIGLNAAIQGTLAPYVSGSMTVGLDHYTLDTDLFYTFGALNTVGAIQTANDQPLSGIRDITNNTGYYSQLQVGFHDALFLTAGLRADQNTNFGDSLNTPVSPRVGGSYAHVVGTATVKFRASYGRAIRPPSPGFKSGSVSSTTVVLPSSAIAPERQRGWDAGIDAVFGTQGSLGVTYYDQTADNLIQLVQTATSPVLTYQYQNIGRVKNTGVEVEGTLALGPLQLKGQYGYARSKIAQLAPGYTGDLLVGDQSLFVPRHTGGLSVGLDALQGTTVVAGLVYVGSWEALDALALYSCFGSTQPCRATPREYTTTYPGFVKINASIAQHISPMLSAFVAVDNLTNNQAYERWNL
jgi:outer membrane receptor protein involved in Fe transport